MQWNITHVWNIGHRFKNWQMINFQEIFWFIVCSKKNNSLQLEQGFKEGLENALKQYGNKNQAMDSLQSQVYMYQWLTELYMFLFN